MVEAIGNTCIPKKIKKLTIFLWQRGPELPYAY